MSLQPPENGHEPGDGAPSAPDEQDSAGAPRSPWSSIVAVVAVLAVAGGIAAFLFLSSDSDPPADGQAAPAEGLACTHLLRAADAHERGDTATYDREIAQAAAVAEETLQKSGQAFGEPERIAVELALGGDANQEPARTERLLERALGVCGDLGSP